MILIKKTLNDDCVVSNELVQNIYQDQRFIQALLKRVNLNLQEEYQNELIGR